MTKVLFPIGSFYPSQIGGPSNTIYWMAKELTKQGVSVTVITSDLGLTEEVSCNVWNDTNYGRVIYCTTRVHYLPWKQIVEGFRQIKNVDIIHLNGLFYPLSWVMAVLGLLYRKSVVWSVRGELQYAALNYSTWKKKPILWIIKLLFKEKATFHATSLDEEKMVNSTIHNSKSIVIPNFISIPKFYKEIKSKNFIFLGRIHPIKKIDVIINAIKISDKFISEGYKLQIIGDRDTKHGLLLSQLTQTLGLSHVISFIGEKTGQEKEKLLSKGYFLILPSDSENFGNVVIEALAQGTPVIASTGTPWSILEENEAGFWVENSIESIAKALDQAIELPVSKYEEYCRNAIDLVAEKYDVSRNIVQWITFYKRLSQK